MRVGLVRDQPVDDGDQANPGEECSHRVPGSELLAVVGSQGLVSLGEDLDHGDVNHDPGGETEHRGQECGVLLFGEERDERADRGGPPGHEGQEEGDTNIVHAGSFRRSDVFIFALLSQLPHHLDTRV